jgi:peptide/nickel transport system ATP-binding protein
MSDQTKPSLEIDAMRIELSSGAPIVEDLGLTVAPGEILGLVGESGSGKTTTALALFGYNAPGLTMTSGEIAIAGERLGGQHAFRNARGRLVSYVPQNPGNSLNPALRVAAALDDIIRGARPDGATPVTSSGLLKRVGLPASDEFRRRYPHQLSGGQQQRVCIAAAMAPKPGLVVLDEPTTGLDVVTQDRILKELLRLRDEEQVAMLYITHDLAVVAQIAGRIAVMYAGHIVELGPAAEILRRPRHPYTRGLLAATPDHLRPRVLEAMPGIAVGVDEQLQGCPFAPRCGQRTARCEIELPALEAVGTGHQVRCFEWRQTPPVRYASTIIDDTSEPARTVAESLLEVEGLAAAYHSGREHVVVARDVSFGVERRGCVALVGESGSGKTTIARAIAGLHTPTAGRILLDGEALAGHARNRTVEQRRRVQIVFQNPSEALNPRHSVLSAIARPAQQLLGLGRAAAEANTRRLLEAVSLSPRTAERFPRELSGGQCQRVAIARALAAKPDVLICDEITSALDVSVQAVVLELLRELRDEFDLSVVFITHDLGVVASIAEHVLVLDRGSICEKGKTMEVLSSPRHPYTQRLLEAAPSLSSAVSAWGPAA